MKDAAECFQLATQIQIRSSDGLGGEWDCAVGEDLSTSFFEANDSKSGITLRNHMFI